MKNEEGGMKKADPAMPIGESFLFFILHSAFYIPHWTGDWRSGSAAPLHGDGRGFESLIAHQTLNFFQSPVAA